jgi:hypothetical protein
MIITTNNIPRQLLPLTDLPKKAQEDFDYLNDPHEYRLVNYKGYWYDVYDSQSITRELGFDQFKGWDSIVSDSFFSGILFRLVGDGEVVVGRYAV